MVTTREGVLAATSVLALFGAGGVVAQVSPPTTKPEVEFLHVVNVKHGGTFGGNVDVESVRRTGAPVFNPPSLFGVQGQTWYVPARMQISNYGSWFTRTSGNSNPFNPLYHTNDGTNHMDSATSGTELPYIHVAQSNYLFSTSAVIPGLSSVTRHASSAWFHATWSKLVVPQTGYWTDEGSIIGYALPRHTGLAIDAVTTTATTSAGTLTLMSNKVAGGALWDLQWVPTSGTTIRPINVFDYGRQIQTSVFMTQWQDPTDPAQNTEPRFFSPLEGGDSHTWISTTTPIQIGDTELAADAAYMNGSPCLTATTGTDSLGRPFQTTEALPIEWWPDNSKNPDSQRHGVWVSSGDIQWKDGPHNPTATASPGIIVYPKWRIGKTAKILTKADDQSVPPNGIPIVEYTTRVTTDCDIGSAWVSRYPAIVEMPIAYLTDDFVLRYDYYPSRPPSARVVPKRLESKGDRIRDYDKAAIILSTKAPSSASNVCFAIYTSSWPIDDAITADPFASSMDASRRSGSSVQPTTGRKSDNFSLISVWREFPHRQEVADTWNANTQREFKAYLVFGTFSQVLANIDWLYQKGY